jgi:beta-lactamase regulating signal transducer with metallopeptidase domain/peptidoglycan/xylan/chitin deacetylase (PgdA/CDA1 family)
MNVETLAGLDMVANVGWTLLHSVWQIGLVSIVLLLVLRILRDQSANLRYLVAVFALAISLLLPVTTFIQISTTTETNFVSEQSGGTRFREAGTEFSNTDDSVTAQPHERAVDVYGNRAANLFSGINRWFNQNVPDLLPFIVFLWFLGVGLFTLRLTGGFSQLRRYRTEATMEPNEWWQQTFSRLCETTTVGKKVALLKSEWVETPIAIGILKPVIVVPASLFLQISPRELETIIAHELIHIRRYDPLVNIVQCVIEAVFFYHPCAWWISAQIRREREFAADAAVMEIFENSHVTYARALANLEEIRLRTNKQMPRYATAANGGNFMQRIKRILKIKTEASTANSAWTAGLACLLTSVFLLAVFWSSSSSLVNAQDRSTTRKLAIGFVSIPPVDRTANPPKDSDATARLLIQKLKEYKVPATGFLQGGMISDGEKLFPVRANIARMWRDAGFEVGLGGFKHIKLYNTPVDEYLANIEKNERVAKELIGEMGLPPRYFSYPFLNTGKSVDDKAKVEAWLGSRGYTSVKYTIDNNEWMYSFAYDMARNDNDVNTMKEIRKAYLEYMTRMFDHYEAYSSELFNRDIPQTMVLTPSRLITDTADEFFAMVTKRGYSFVSVDEAQSDAAYKTREDFTGEAGISWFERWSLAKGKRLRAEPEVDRVVKNIWDERQIAAKK